MKLGTTIAAIAFLLCTTGASASVTALPGSDDQTTRIGAAFPNPVRLLVRDDAGSPVANVQVRLLTYPVQPVVCCLSGDALSWQTWAITAADGIAVFPLLRGQIPGTTVFNVDILRGGLSTKLGTTTLRVNVSTDAPPARLVNLSPAVTLPAAERKADAFQVQVLDSAGNPVPRAVVLFRDSADNRDPPAGTYPVTGTFDVDAPTLYSSLDVVADESGIATVAFTPALAKPSRHDAAVGAAATGSVTAAVGYYAELRIPYTVAPAAASATLQDLWWAGPTENGWGVSVIEHPADTDFQLPRLFVLLFIYDQAGNPVWYVMPFGSWVSGYGSRWTAPIYKPHGTPFYSYDASSHRIGEQVGEMQLDFAGARGMTLNYRFYGFVPAQSEAGVGTKSLTRLDFSNGTPSPRQQASDLWWGGQAQNGWGIAIHENPGALFNLWFTYGDDGKPVWFAMSNGAWIDGNTFAGPIFKPFASRWIGVPYDPATHREDEVGSFTMRLAPGTPPAQATFTYSVGSHRGSENLSRVPF